jgi:prepilin-type N-terminal cleavage/methylation domain-containing protein
MHALSGYKGFTIIEVIIVAVIVAVLASVGIPMYRGYIMGQRQTTVNNLAQTAGAAANSYWRRTNVVPAYNDFLPMSNTLGLYYSNSGYNITISGNTITVTDKTYTTISNSTVTIN